MAKQACPIWSKGGLDVFLTLVRVMHTHIDTEQIAKYLIDTFDTLSSLVSDACSQWGNNETVPGLPASALTGRERERERETKRGRAAE